jgi:hypothetical protein
MHLFLRGSRNGNKPPTESVVIRATPDTALSREVSEAGITILLPVL